MPVALHTREYLVWLMALVVFVILAPYIKQFVVFILNELYDIFIQHNPNPNDHQYH
jgi:hypothetical protein